MCIMPVKDVEPKRLIGKASEEMKKMAEFKPPEWAVFVKTGISRERPPTQPDWWYTRAAAVLRKLYIHPEGIGVQKLRNMYGSRKNRGHKPEHKYKASGAILRRVMKQLEAAGFVKTEKSKGRIITQKGKAFLSNIAKEMK
jgi:small subunit ribosomal protein S19e